MAEDAANIFKVFDKDFDGKLQTLEMHQALGAAGVCPSIEDLQEALKDVGPAGGDFDCFLRLLEQFKSTKPTPQALEPLFKVVDPSKTGKVEVSSLRFLLINFNEKLSDEEAGEFLEQLELKEGQADIKDVCNKLAKLVG